MPDCNIWKPNQISPVLSQLITKVKVEQTICQSPTASPIRTHSTCPGGWCISRLWEVQAILVFTLRCSLWYAHTLLQAGPPHWNRHSLRQYMMWLQLAPVLFQMVNHNHTDKDTRKQTVFLGFYSSYELKSTHTTVSSDLFELLKRIYVFYLKTVAVQTCKNGNASWLWCWKV